MLHVARPEAVRKAAWAALEAARDALATHAKKQCARRYDNCTGNGDCAGVALARSRPSAYYQLEMWRQVKRARSTAGGATHGRGGPLGLLSWRGGVEARARGVPRWHCVLVLGVWVCLDVL